MSPDNDVNRYRYSFHSLKCKDPNYIIYYFTDMLTDQWNGIFYYNPITKIQSNKSNQMKLMLYYKLWKGQQTSWNIIQQIVIINFQSLGNIIASCTYPKSVPCEAMPIFNVVGYETKNASHHVHFIHPLDMKELFKIMVI